MQINDYLCSLCNWEKQIQYTVNTASSVIMSALMPQSSIARAFLLNYQYHQKAAHSSIQGK